MACRAATSSFDRAPTTLAVGRPPQGDRRFPCWRRATPRGRPETTPARRPDLPRQPGRRTPRNANSNTRPISFDRSFGPPSGAKTTPLWRDYVRARELVQRKLKPCLTVGRGEKGVFCKGDGSPGRLRSARIWRATATNAPPQAPPAGTIRAKASRRARAQPQPRRRALLHDLAAETEQRRRPPPGRGRGLAGRLD